MAGNSVCRQLNYRILGCDITCATILLAAGEQAHVVQARLGHDNIKTTLDIYAHVLPSQQADAARKIGMMPQP